MTNSCNIISFKNVSRRGINIFNFRVKSTSGKFYDLKFNESKNPIISCNCIEGLASGIRKEKGCHHKKRIWNLIEDLRSN